MTQKGTHTWDLNLQYHRCPKCGLIIESREGFQYNLGIWAKNLECDRCSHRFTVTKQRQPTFGPLIGDPQPTEVKWD